jgi:hypothetical protein
VLFRGFFLMPQACCLTGRSSGPPPARHLGREALWFIIHLAAQAPRRFRPLSSNVRRRRLQQCSPTKPSRTLFCCSTSRSSCSSLQALRSLWQETCGTGAELTTCGSVSLTSPRLPSLSFNPGWVSSALSPRWSLGCGQGRCTPSYSKSFIEHWVQRVVFYEAPFWVFVLAYTAFGLLVAWAWWRFPPRRNARGTERDA